MTLAFVLVLPQAPRTKMLKLGVALIGLGVAWAAESATVLLGVKYPATVEEAGEASAAQSAAIARGLCAAALLPQSTQAKAFDSA